MKVSKKLIAAKLIGEAIIKKKKSVLLLTTAVLVSLSARLAPPLSLAWTFLYLLFFRLVKSYDLLSPSPFANAIQLLLTLKVPDPRPVCTAAATRHCATLPDASLCLCLRW